MVNTGGSGLPLARLLGGGITLVVRGTISDSEVAFSCKHELFIGQIKSYFTLEHLCIYVTLWCARFWGFFLSKITGLNIQLLCLGF